MSYRVILNERAEGQLEADRRFGVRIAWIRSDQVGIHFQRRFFDPDCPESCRKDLLLVAGSRLGIKR
jgi:hypothetical protein